MTNSEQLQKELGDGFRVLRWVTSKGNSESDEVVIERVADRRYEVFYVDNPLTSVVSDEFYLMTFSACIVDQFAKIEISNKRQNAFEQIVKSQKLPLMLDRLSNGSRYESMETEWAFRFYCKGLDACVGWPTEKVG